MTAAARLQGWGKTMPRVSKRLIINRLYGFKKGHDQRRGVQEASLGSRRIKVTYNEESYQCLTQEDKG